MLYYNQSTNSVFKDLKSDPGGLAKSEASERLAVHGLNEIKVQGESFWRKLIEPFANVFMLVLFLAAVISLFHGDTLDASIILLIIAVSAIIYYIQKFSTERILRSLQKHVKQEVDVIRDGKHTTVDTSLLVPGDVISLREGDKVPADARLISGSNVRTDESLLTGESLPIAKSPEAISGEKEVYEQANMLFQGSFLVSGEVSAIVTTTGNETEFGKIAALSKTAKASSPVQKKIDKLISQIVAVVAALAVVGFTLAMYRGTELAESLKFVMALAVSAVPESLPVAISVILVLGMRRMAARKALVRNMRAIETIGVITTIATDKTGTLTKNKLTVQEVWQLPGSKENLVSCLDQSINKGQEKAHDPLDTAMLAYVKHEDQKAPKGSLEVSLPFDQSVSMSGNLWNRGSNKYELALKGAPESIISHSDLTEEEKEQAEQALHGLTAQGYRVIALARSPISKRIDKFENLPARLRFEFVGLVAVADVLRPEAKRAIATALNAGVTVRMITGDHQETAYNIAKQLGMVENRSQVFDSRRMHTMSDQDLRDTIDNIRVFSRVVPESKYRILTLLKEKEITAMTGDGVNDVPALANANVGVAMGAGSEIAKDAGDIILLDNNFKSIVEAMREGRIILGNMRRMLFYLLSTNAGEALTMLGALVIGLPLPLLPVQLLWINLVTDTSMVIPLGLEPGEKDTMKRKPSKPSSPILSKLMVSRMILMALLMATLALSFYIFYSSQHDHEYARTIVFSALVVMQWANAFNARSDFQSVLGRIKTWSGAFYTGLLISVTLQGLVIVGPLGDLLHMTEVATQDLITTGIISLILPIVAVEIHKALSRRFWQKHY